jgi:hypothetical protein
MYCIIWSLKKEDKWELFTNQCFMHEKDAAEFASKQKSRKHIFKIGKVEDWFYGKRKEKETDKV